MCVLNEVKVKGHDMAHGAYIIHTIRLKSIPTVHFITTIIIEQIINIQLKKTVEVRHSKQTDCLSVLLEQSLSLLRDSLLSSLSSRSVLSSSSLSLILQSLLTGSLSLSSNDVFNEGTLVLEGVTLSRLVEGVVQVSVDLTSISVLSEQSSQDSQSSDPDNLGWETGLLGTFSLTETTVTTGTLGLSKGSSTGSGVDTSWLLDDGTVLVELSDSLTRVGLRNLSGLIWVQPDFSLTDTNDGSSKSLLSSQVSPVCLLVLVFLICAMYCYTIGRLVEMGM